MSSDFDISNIIAAAAEAAKNGVDKEPSPTSAAGLPFMPDEETMKQQVRQSIKAIINGFSASFSCGGQIALESPPTIELVPSKEKFTIQPVTECTDEKAVYQTAKEKAMVEQQRKELDSLISKMPQAAFGHGGETVYDKNVRSALQLKAEDFTIDIPQSKLDEILAQVKESLAIQTDLVAEPYSLNVYEKDGKFAKHKDTPRGEDMIGTLVLCLPSLFLGGRMVVSQGQETVEYLGKGYSWNSAPKGGADEWWKSSSNANVNAGVIPYCAFFADVDHEIMKVDAGVRVTLAYLLRRKDHQSAVSVLPRALTTQDEKSNALFESFQSIFRNEQIFPDGGKIGIPCVHLYTNGQVFPKGADSSDALSEKAIKKLKGRDLLVAQAASAAGLEVFIVPYLANEYSQEGAGDFRLEKFPTKSTMPKKSWDDRIETAFNTVGRDYPDQMADLWIVDYDEGAHKELGSSEYNAEGYFGNEASDLDFYVYAALIVEVPDGTVRMFAKKRKTAS